MSLLQRRPRIGGDLKDIQKRGGKVVVVDPREAETTKISDQHIMIRPGTDLFLLLGMMKNIIDHKLYDQEFVNNRSKKCIYYYLIPKRIEGITLIYYTTIRS